MMIKQIGINSEVSSNKEMFSWSEIQNLNTWDTKDVKVIKFPFNIEKLCRKLPFLLPILARIILWRK